MMSFAKKICIIAIVLSVAMCFVACGGNDTATQKLGFTDSQNEYLVFYDDFNSDALDQTFWNVYGSNGEHIRRGGYWDPNQVILENGQLILRTAQKDGKYYTGAIDTKGKFERAYGYYEARCKLPKATGLWSAFWLMSTEMEKGNNQSSDVTKVGAEIDIMESPYYKTILNKTMYQCAVHIGDYDQNYIKKEQLVMNAVDGTATTIYDDDWHTYAVDWSESGYRFYCDRHLVFEITDSRYISPVKDFLFLSVEIGGSDGVADSMPFIFGQSIDANERDTFPVDFSVDWVAVYSQKPF